MRLVIRDGKFCALTQYGEWAAKDAGFTWSKEQKCWWSEDPTKARTLAERIGQSFETEAVAAPVVQAPKSKVHAEVMEIEAALTESDIPLIHEGLRILAGKCDYARTHDGKGFGAYHADLGHKLADEAKLTRNQAAWGKRMLKWYRKQLPADLYEALFATQTVLA